MNAVISNLSSLDWWVTGLFFAIIGSTLPFAYKKISLIPSHFINCLKKSKIKELKKIRAIRQYGFLINKEIIKTYAYLSIFSIICVMFSYSYFLDPIMLTAIEKTPVKDLFDVHLGYSYFTSSRNIVFLILSIPLYVSEIVYLRQKSFLKTLEKYTLKLHKKRIKNNMLTSVSTTDAVTARNS